MLIRVVLVSDHALGDHLQSESLLPHLRYFGVNVCETLGSPHPWLTAWIDRSLRAYKVGEFSGLFTPTALGERMSHIQFCEDASAIQFIPQGVYSRYRDVTFFDGQVRLSHIQILSNLSVCFLSHDNVREPIHLLMDPMALLWHLE